MYVKLSGCIHVGLWIAVLFFQTVVMDDNISDSTIQPSREFTPTAVTSSSTIEIRTSLHSSILHTFNQQSLEISPTRTLQTFSVQGNSVQGNSVQGNSVVTSDTHVQTSSFTPLVIPRSTDTIHIPSSSDLFMNQLIDSSITASESLESSKVSVSALVMTSLRTNTDTSAKSISISAMTSFNELSSSTVLYSNRESESSDSVSGFNNDITEAESNTFQSFLTDSLISKSVISNIISSRNSDISSSSIISPSHILLSDSSVIILTSSERVNEMETQTLAVLSRDSLDSSVSVDQNVPENSYSSSVSDTDLTGKSNYESNSRMSISQSITRTSGSFSSLTSSTTTEYYNAHATSGANTNMYPSGETIATVSESSSQGVSSFNIDEMHSLSEQFVSKSHNHVFGSISTHDLLMSPSYITNTVFNTMQTFYSTSTEGTPTKDSDLTTTIGTNQPTGTYSQKVDTTSVYSDQTLSPSMSLRGTEDISEKSTTYLSLTTSQTGILTSLLDVQSYSDSEHFSGTPDTYSVDPISTSVLKSSFIVQQLTTTQNEESIMISSENDLSRSGLAPSVTLSLNERSTEVLSVTSSNYFESFVSTVDITTSVTQVKTSASRLVTKSVHSSHIQISSNDTDSDTLTTRFTAEVSEMPSSHATTFATAQNNSFSTEDNMLNSASSSLPLLESSISPSPTEQVKLTNVSDSTSYGHNSTKNSDTESFSTSFSSEIVAKITPSMASSDRSNITGSDFSSSYSNNANSVISATESMRQHEQNLTSPTSSADTSTSSPLHPTKSSLYSVSNSDSSILSSHSRTNSLMDLSKLTSNIIDTSAYSKAISSISEKGKEETTFLGISSTWFSNSLFASYQTDEAVSLPMGDSSRTIDSMHTTHQSESSLFEMKSSKYPISSGIFNSADNMSPSLILSVVSSSYPVSLGSDSLSSRSSILTYDASEIYSKTNESQMKVSGASSSSYSLGIDANSVISSSTRRHDSSMFPGSSGFSSSSDQLVSASYDTPEVSVDTYNSISSGFTTDILSSKSESTEPSSVTAFSVLSDTQSSGSGSHSEISNIQTSTYLPESNVFSTADETLKSVTTTQIEGSSSLAVPSSSKYTSPESYLSTSYTSSEETSTESHSIYTSGPNSESLKSNTDLSPTTPFVESSLTENNYTVIISSITLSPSNILTHISSLLISANDLTSTLITTDAKSVMYSTTLKQDNSIFPVTPKFSSSSDQLVSTTYDTPEVSVDTFNSISSDFTADILSSKSEAILKHTSATASLESSMSMPSSIDLSTPVSSLSKHVISDSFSVSPTSPLDTQPANTFTQSVLLTLSIPSVVTPTDYTSNTFSTGLFELESANSESTDSSSVTAFSGMSEIQTSGSRSHDKMSDIQTLSYLSDSNVFSTADETLKSVTTTPIEISSSLDIPSSSKYTSPELYISTSYTSSEQSSNELDSIYSSRSNSESLRSMIDSSRTSSLLESSLIANNYSMISPSNIPSQTHISNLLTTAQELSSTLVTDNENVSSFPTLSSTSSEYSTYLENITPNTITLTSESFSSTPMSFTTGLSFSDIQSTSSSMYSMVSNDSTLPELSNISIVTAATSQTTVSLISKEAPITTYIPKSASSVIDSSSSYVSIHQTSVEFSSIFPSSTINELLSTELKSSNYSLIAPSHTVLNKTILTTLSEYSDSSFVVSSTPNNVTLSENVSSKSVFAPGDTSSIETYIESYTTSTQSVVFESSQLPSSPPLSLTSLFSTSDTYHGASSDISNIINSTRVNQTAISANEQFSTSFMSRNSTFVSSSDMYHFSSDASSKHISIGLSKLYPSATATDSLSTERISSTFSEHSISSSSILANTTISVSSYSSINNNSAPARTILPTDSFTIMPTTTFVNHEGNVSLESSFPISSTEESSTSLFINDSRESLTTESTHPESSTKLSVSSFISTNATDTSASYSHIDGLVSSYVSNTLSTISTDQREVSSKTITDEELLTDMTSRTFEIRSSIDTSPPYVASGLASSEFSTLSLLPSMTKLSTESYSSSLLLSGSSLIVHSSIIPSPTPLNPTTVFDSSLSRLSLFSTNSIIVSPTSSLFTKQENVSQSLFSNLSISSMMFSTSSGNNISSQITRTNSFSQITETVFDGTNSQLSSPVALVSLTSIFLTYSTYYNSVSITSTGSSPFSEESLNYTGMAPDVSETFSTLASMLITSDNLQTIVDNSSVWNTDTIQSGEVSQSTLQPEPTNSFVNVISESSLPSATLQSTFGVSSISLYVGTSTSLLETSYSNSILNSTSLMDLSTIHIGESFTTDNQSSESTFYVSYHSDVKSSMVATLPSTHTGISPKISTTPTSSVITILPSLSEQITQGVYSTNVSSSNTDVNASSFENIASRSIFDTTLIDSTVASYSFENSINSSLTQTSPNDNATASVNPGTIFPSVSVTEVLDNLSTLSMQSSFSEYTSSSTFVTVNPVTTRSTLFTSPTFTSPFIQSKSFSISSESTAATSQEVVISSSFEQSLMPTITLTASLSPTAISLTSTLDSTNVSALLSILSTPTSSEELLSSYLTLPASRDSSDSITVLPTSPIVSTSHMTSYFLGSSGSESSIYVTVTDTFIGSLSTVSFFSESSFLPVLSSYVTPLSKPPTSAPTTTFNTTMLLFTDVSSSNDNTSEMSISSVLVSSNFTTTSKFSINDVESSLSIIQSQSFLENATISILSTTEYVFPSSHSSSYLTSDESRTGQYSSILSTGIPSNTFIDTSEPLFSTLMSSIIEDSSTLATPELSSSKSSSIPMLSSVVSQVPPTTLQILLTTKDVSSTGGSTMLTSLVSRTVDSELMPESSKMTQTLSHDSSFSSTRSVSQFPSNVVSSFIESSVHPSSYFSSILSMSPVVSQSPSSSELTLAVESSLESSRYSDTLVSVLPASTNTLVMSSSDVPESTKPVDSKSLSPHPDTASTELLTVSSPSLSESTTITDIISSTIAPVSTVESTINSTALSATISPTSSSYFMTNDSDNSTSFIMSSLESLNSTEVQSQNISMGNETLATFSVTPLLSSVLETVSVSSSIFTPTTEPPEVTTVNITNIEEAFWVRTVLKIQRWVNITDPKFLKEMEGRLAEAYNEAFIRLKLIQEGKFEPLQRRRRKKRFATSGEAAVHIHDMTRKKDSSTVTVVYAVERSGDILTAQTAVTALQVLDDQELAIILRQVVDTKAETYGQTPKREDTSDDNFPLWLIGAIAGGAAAVIILLWIILCIYCKCCKRKDSDMEAEPELMSIIPDSPKGKDSVIRPLPQTPMKKSIDQPTTSHYSFNTANNYKMSVPDRDPVETIDERKVFETPVRREPPPKPQLSSPEGSTIVTPVLPKRELAPPGVEKGRRNSKNSIGPSINDLELRRESVLSKDRRTEISQLFQSTVSEDSDGVKEQIKTEKMKNKELLREKYGQDVDMCADRGHQYDSTDRIMLDIPTTPIQSYVIANGSPEKKSVTNQRRHSEGEPQSGEPLEEAKTRMHQLLDDAFSLISPRKHEDFTGKRDSLPSNKDPELPFSGYTNPAYSHSSSDYFETWSPYRASDQVALISMPHTLVSSVTKLGQKSEKRPTATKIGKRPASNLDILNMKALPSQTNDNKKSSSGLVMTKEPPEPILLRTKDDNSKNRINSTDSRTTFSNLRPNNGNTHTSKLNSGLILNGNVTSLSKLSSTDLSHSRKESVEMKPLNQNGWNTIRSHRVPDKNLRNKDELDVIQSIQPHERTDNLIQSLRDEIKSLSTPETEEDINKKPIRRKNRKVNKPMTDIM